MTTWKPKPVPWWYWHRWIHAAAAFSVTIAASSSWHYSGLGWASAGILFGASAWEILTRTFGRPLKWKWLFGDVLDLASFVVGWLIAVFICVAR